MVELSAHDSEVGHEDPDANAGGKHSNAKANRLALQLRYLLKNMHHSEMQLFLRLRIHSRNKQQKPNDNLLGERSSRYS